MTPFSRLAAASLNDTSLTLSEKVEKALSAVWTSGWGIGAGAAGLGATLGVESSLPPPTDLPPPPELKLFSALAISEAFACLIGMTSDTYSEGVATSTLATNSEMRLTFSGVSRKTSIWLLSMGRIELEIPARGWIAPTSSLGLAYFNWTTCVTYWPSSGNCAALLVSKRPPEALPCASGTAFMNLSPTFTIVMPLSANAPSRA
jgi:hypothetical protein